MSEAIQNRTLPEAPRKRADLSRKRDMPYGSVSVHNKRQQHLALCKWRKALSPAEALEKCPWLEEFPRTGSSDPSSKLGFRYAAAAADLRHYTYKLYKKPSAGNDPFVERHQQEAFERLYDLLSPNEQGSDLTQSIATSGRVPHSTDPKSVSENRDPRKSSDTKEDKIEKLIKENQQLSLKIDLLGAELRRNVPHLQLYRFGAGALTPSITSLVSLYLTGISVPFHPVFATMMIPVGAVFMIMAWKTRKNDNFTNS